MAELEQIQLGTTTYDIRDTSKAVPSSALSLTLAAGSWSSATPPTQTVTATGVTATNNVIVSFASTITAEQLNDVYDGKIFCSAQGENSLTFVCYGTEPTENIPITVLIVG